MLTDEIETKSVAFEETNVTEGVLPVLLRYKNEPELDLGKSVFPLLP